MKGDFSRRSFDRRKHYRSVLQQQGRVQLDADWNEQAAIIGYRTETGTIDNIGGCGGPEGNAGFKLVNRGPEFALPGGGIRPGEAVLPGKEGGNPSGGAVILGAEKKLSKKAAMEGPTEIPAGGKSSSGVIITAGRYYVDGMLIENEHDVAITAQPDLPHSNSNPFSEQGRYLVYLDVWERHITALDDPAIREVALGGPDTTTRSKTVWQVKTKWIDAELTGGCKDIPGYGDVIRTPTGLMSAREKPGVSTTDPCSIPPGAGFRGLENQLYRVEVHIGGDRTLATYKWSRDNGSVVTTIEKIADRKITVDSLGPDAMLGFAPEQWVELSDDTLELQGLPGQLLQIESIDPGLRIITLKSVATPLDATNTLDGINAALRPKLRRWDGTGVMNAAAGYVDLEDGIQVAFTNGDYRSGDYWLIPARTAMGAEGGHIEWLHTGNVWQERAPFGIKHHYCRIAVVKNSGGEKPIEIEDCRCIFSPLTRLSGLFYVGGDGQEARPGNRLPQLLQVGVFNIGVSNRCVPVAGAKIRFTTTDGVLSVEAPDAVGIGAPLDHPVLTDANGIAGVYWRPNREKGNSRTVTAEWLNAEDIPSPQRINFHCNLSIAEEVAYDSGRSKCMPQEMQTVQEAIDYLCEQMKRCHDPAACHVTDLRIGSTEAKSTDALPLVNGEVYTLRQLAAGVQITCDRPLDASTIADPVLRAGSTRPSQSLEMRGEPTCFITAEIPFPVHPQDRLQWGTDGTVKQTSPPTSFPKFQWAGYQPLVLHAQVGLSPDNTTIIWQLDKNGALHFLTTLFKMMLNKDYGLNLDRLLLRMTLKGNFIQRQDAKDYSGYLDGETYRDAAKPEKSGLKLPSGDSCRGGDFEMWFWLVRPQTGKAIDKTIISGITTAQIKKLELAQIATIDDLAEMDVQKLASVLNIPPAKADTLIRKAITFVATSK